MKIDDKYINTLVRSGILTVHFVERFMIDYDLRPGEGGVLIALYHAGEVSEEDIARAMALEHNLEYVDLRRIMPDASATELLSRDVAEFLNCFPYKQVGDIVFLAVTNPENRALIDVAKEFCGEHLRIAVTTTAILKYAQITHLLTEKERNPLSRQKGASPGEPLELWELVARKNGQLNLAI